MKIKVIVTEFLAHQQIDVDARCYTEKNEPIMDTDTGGNPYHMGQVCSSLGWAKIDIPSRNIKKLQELFPGVQEFEFEFEYVKYMAPVNKQVILGIIEDLVSEFLYYNRKECETLPAGEIENALKTGEITVDEMVDKFRSSLEEKLK